MKIALLNLQYDSNYGGNLQRFALATVLQRMGHDVTHLNLRFKFYPDNKLLYLKTLFFRVYDKFVKGLSVEVLQEKKNKLRYLESCKNTESFYQKYIKHTEPIFSKKKLRKYLSFDAFIVGSDQVWRKKFTQIHGIEPFFFDYLPKEKKRIAYGVSFGTDENELSSEDLNLLTPLYKQFQAVSVRETSALKLLKEYQWTIPSAEVVLDPTLLLSKEDYNQIITDNDTKPIRGDLFCYILDETSEKNDYINLFSKEKGLTPFKCPLGGSSIPQWLRSFKDSKYVITDSYHGILFSIIYNKPFFFFKNEFRGMSRFSSLESIFNFQLNSVNYDWDEINKQLYLMRQRSILFIEKALSCR